MIARLRHSFITGSNPKWVAQLVTAIAAHNHLIDCSSDTMEWIEQATAGYCGPTEQALISTPALYKITAQQRRYLTTIHVDGSRPHTDYLNFFSQPSLLLLENGPFEWPVYLNMLDRYRKDREYGSIFSMLLKGATESPRTLRPLHAGGNGHFEALTRFMDSTPEYHNLARYKIYVITDSDRESAEANYQPTPKALYRFFTGITDKNAGIDRARHIDTLAQPLYHWHMWRKRAIENYFPPEAYENIGLNADEYRSLPPAERDFCVIDDKKTSPVKNYEKKKLPQVAAAMSKSDYEASCDTLTVNATHLSEIRLFLLKMAKVI